MKPEKNVGGGVPSPRRESTHCAVQRAEAEAEAEA